MDLFFAPLACSLATRIALYEAGAEAHLIPVDLRRKRTEEGDDFFTINPMGQVPVLRMDDGTLLAENAAILCYVADRFPEARLAPAAGAERYRLQQWLSFIGTELHKTFIPLLDPKAHEGAKAFARAKLPQRLAVLDRHLAGREFLMDRFSVADAYLTTVLNWTVPTAVDLGEWPVLKAYHQRMHMRPALAKAFSEERALYAEEQARALAS